MSELEQALTEAGITSEAKHLRFVGREIDGSLNDWPHDEWAITLINGERRLTLSYMTGVGHRKMAWGVIKEKNRYSNRMGDWARNEVEAVELGMLIFPRPTLGKFRGKTWHPSTADTMSCYLSDASSAEESFTNWCSSFGESNDSIKALATYMECQKTRDGLIKLLGGEKLLNELAGKEH